MRVLHLGKYWHKDGGIESHVKALCKGLAAAGLDVVNLVSSTTHTGSHFEHDAYMVVESPSLGIYFSTSIAPRMLVDARKLHAAKPFDLIHLHFPDPMSHLVSMALPEDIPRVITWHSDIVKQRHLLKLYRPFQLQAIHRSKAIVAATTSHFASTTQIPSSYPATQRHVIPYGMDFDWLAPTPGTRTKANTIRQQAQGRFVVFALGRHVAYKGFGVLIDAMQHNQAFLILGGDGPLSFELKAQAQRLGLADRMCFTGRLSSADIAAHYHACDAFCLPSVTPNEAFGIVQIEAMACGKPVICTQLSNGVNAVNPHNITGLTVPANDSIALSSAIETLCVDTTLRQRLGQKAQEHALTTYAMQTMTQMHAALYESLVTTPCKE